MNWIIEMDMQILYWLDQIHHPILDAMMIFFTTIGDNGYVWIALGILLLCLSKYRKHGIYLFSTLLLEVCVVSVMMKPFFSRLRPFMVDTNMQLLIEPPHGYSFPSGHTASSFAAATIIALIEPKWGKYAFVCASLISISRNYLFVHYPSDVVVGALIGVACGFVVHQIGKKVEQKRRKSI